MSVITKRGDEGQTDLMFGKRLSKSAPRLDAYGTVDELNTCLGVARAAGVKEDSENIIDSVQERLIGLMGELATLEEDLPRYDERGYARLKDEDVSWIENTAKTLESEENIKFKGWARPGKDASLGAAMLDMARATCRRAERRMAQLREDGELSNGASSLFINRLSDLLWILARRESV